MYRYVPAFGEPEKADAEHTIFDSHEPTPDAKPLVVVQLWDNVANFISRQKTELRFGNGTDIRIASLDVLKFEAKGWAKLLTVNHIVETLASIPVYEVLEAKSEFLLLYEI